MMCPMRRALILVLVAAAFGISLLPAAHGGVKRGWSTAKASTYLKVHLRLADPTVVAAASDYLQKMKQIGDASGIALAESQLRDAKSGLAVDRATCLGVRPAPGGYVSFRCKLSLSDHREFTAEAAGTWRLRPASGNWQWHTASWVLGSLAGH